MSRRLPLGAPNASSSCVMLRNAFHRGRLKAMIYGITRKRSPDTDPLEISVTLIAFVFRAAGTEVLLKLRKVRGGASVKNETLLGEVLSSSDCERAQTLAAAAPFM